MKSTLADVPDEQIVKAYTQLGKASNKANEKELLDYKLASIPVPNPTGNAEKDLKIVASLIREYCSLTLNSDVLKALMVEIYKD